MIAAEQSRSISLLAQTVLCAVAVVCLLYIPIPILPYLEQTYQLAPGQAGLALSAFSAAYASGYVMFGVLSDRFGRRAVVVGGLLALTLITLAMVWLHENAPSWRAFVFLRVLQGWAASVFPPAALVYVAGRGTASQRMWAVTWMGAAFFSSGLLGQIYGLQIVVPLGLGWAMCLLVGVYVLTAVRYLFVKEEKPVQVQFAKKPLWRGLWDSYRPIFSLLAHRDLWRVYLTALLILFCFVAFYLALDTYLGDVMAQVGISRLQMRMVALPVFLVPLCAPKLMDRLGVQRVLVMGLSGSMLGLLASALLALIDPVWILGSSIVFVAGIGLVVPGLNFRVAAASAPELRPLRGQATALYAFTLFVGTSFAPGFNQLLRPLPLSGVLLALALIMGVAVLCNMTGRGADRSASENQAG